MGRWHKGVTVTATVVSAVLSQGIKKFIFSFSYYGNEANRGVDYRHSNTQRLENSVPMGKWGMEVHTRFPLGSYSSNLFGTNIFNRKNPCFYVGIIFSL